jgi:tellurite resistance protein
MSTEMEHERITRWRLIDVLIMASAHTNPALGSAQSASGFELNTFVDFQPKLRNSTRKINKKTEVGGGR